MGLGSWVIWAVALLGLTSQAQTTAALSVRLTSPDGKTVTQAAVTLANEATGLRRSLARAGADAFRLSDIPPQDYTLTVRSKGFATYTQEVPLRAGMQAALEILLSLAPVVENVVVTASESLALVDTAATGTRVALSAAVLETVPIPPGSRGLEAYLVTFPGFAPNANGAIHPRGAHNQMTYVIDGLPISDQLTGAFATALDASIVDTLELYTGDVPAEFGSKVSGVASISTRSGSGTGRKFFGSTELGGGGFGTLQAVTHAGGEAGRLSYYGSIFAVKTNRFLDAVSLDNLHNGGNSERGFLRLDYQMSEGGWLRFNAMAGRSNYQLANLRSQHAAGMDQRQALRDASFWTRWSRLLSPSATWESTVAYRSTIAQLFSSPHDTPVTASQARHLTTVTTANRLNWVLGAHSLRGGVDVQHFPVSENFSMGITSPGFNLPGSPGFNDALLAHDLTRGGGLFHFSRKASGTQYSVFAQDVVRMGRFTASAGLRYDNYRFLVNGSQMQPRAGLAFHLKETSTVFRASYNRNYQTPPNENLLLSSSEEASRLAPSSVREALGHTVVPLRPQRENVYEMGIQQGLFRRAGLNVSFYHKNSRDQQDNNNFFDTGIIFPVTLARIRVNGVEGRLLLPSVRGVTATLSATHSRAVSTPPFTGGLFVGQDAVALLSAGPFIIDHDQVLSMQTNVHYTLNRNWWTSLSIRHDSGLVANPSTPAEVAADPDYADLLPYVKLDGNPARVRPRTITDTAFGYQRWRGDRRAWEFVVQCSNLFDATALYNFQSVFVGTRLVGPRSASAKFRLFW